MELSTAQQVFAAFYAILFGIMLHMVIGFAPLQWERICEDKHQKMLRNRPFCSLILLNFLPILYFIGIFRILQDKHFCFSNCYQIVFSVLIVLSAIGVFFFYRLFLIAFCCRKIGNWEFWSDYQNECRDCPARDRSPNEIQEDCRYKMKSKDCWWAIRVLDKTFLTNNYKMATWDENLKKKLLSG
jgi:hypothetical protein